MAAVAEGIAAGAAATAHQHGARLLQLNLTSDQPTAQMGAVAEPALAAAAAAAEVGAAGGQIKRLRTVSGGNGP